MKKTFSLFFTVVVLTMSLVIPSFSTCAKERTETAERIINQTVEYFDDGSYVVITSKESTEINWRSTYNKSGLRTVAMYAKNDTELWRFTVYGTFSVDPGVSATCTAASCSCSIADDAWQNESASAYCSGNQAIGDATFIRKLLGITVESKDCHVVLTCDKNGNLS